jgi:plasmid replication initiation protein
MSFKGHNHSLAVRTKISLDNQKNRTIIDNKVIDYINCIKKSDFPNLTDCAIHAGISEKRLIQYELTTGEDSTIRLALDLIRDLQKSSLMKNGLYKIFDNKITTLLLKANHGLREEPTHLEQNNIFNISPEILAEALEISRTKKAPKLES